MGRVIDGAMGGDIGRDIRHVAPQIDTCPRRVGMDGRRADQAGRSRAGGRSRAARRTRSTEPADGRSRAGGRSRPAPQLRPPGRASSARRAPGRRCGGCRRESSSICSAIFVHLGDRRSGSTTACRSTCRRSRHTWPELAIGIHDLSPSRARQQRILPRLVDRQASRRAAAASTACARSSAVLMIKSAHGDGGDRVRSTPSR